MAGEKEIAKLLVTIGADLSELKEGLVDSVKAAKDTAKAVSFIGVAGRKAMLELASSSTLANAYMNQMHALVGMIADSFLSELAPSIEPVLADITELANTIAKIPETLDGINTGINDIKTNTESGNVEIGDQLSLWELILRSVSLQGEAYDALADESIKGVTEGLQGMYEEHRKINEVLGIHVERARKIKELYGEIGEKVKDAFTPGGTGGVAGAFFPGGSTVFDAIKKGIGGI